MINEERYLKLKRQLDQLTKQRDEASGALKQLKQTLKEEFGCKTVGEAKTLLRKLTRDQKKYEEKFEQELNDFETRFGKLLKAMEEGDTELYGTVPDELKSRRKGKERS